MSKSSNSKKENSDPTEIEALFHLEYLNDMVKQINKIKNNIISDVYKNYIKKDGKVDIDLKTFKSSIIKKDREEFITSKSKSK